MNDDPAPAASDRAANRAGKRHIWPARGDRHQRALRRAFLPGALEIQERPPSPAAHWLLWVLLALFAAAVTWAAIGEVDIVVSAPGRVVPSGQVKVVQAPEVGSIARIHVHDGQRVEAGQPLVSLETTFANADDTRLARQLEHNALHRHWRQALEDWLAAGRPRAAALPAQPGAPAADAVLALSLYRQQQAEIEHTLGSLNEDLAASRAAVQTLRAEERRARSTLAILDERVTAYKTLVDRQFGARAQYLEMLQQKTELEQSIPVLQSRQQQARADAAAITARRQAAEEELRKHNLLELARLAAERDSLAQEARKARLRQAHLLVTAPVTGTVQELAVHTIGGVVTAAQPLLKVVPEGAAIEIEARLANRDIGFVGEGQRAEVKVEAFNFTKYGLLAAKVVNISEDAVADDAGSWAFRMRLALERDYLAVEGKNVKLSPGMAVTAEVRTGKRRLIEFFLSPLLRYRQESLRER